MKDVYRKHDELMKIEILENATIIYDDGDRAIFKAIFLNDKKVIIFGEILTIENQDRSKSYGNIDCYDVFLECGGIPKDNIKSIEGGTKKIVFKNVNKES